MNRTLSTTLSLMGLTAALSGCPTASITPDVTAVGELSRLGVPRIVQVDDEPPPGVGRLDQPLDTDAAVHLALLHNRQLRAELVELGVARGALIQAGVVENPTFEVEVLPERDARLELRVEHEITSLILAPSKVGVAEAELEAARLEVAARVLRLGYRVRVAFHALQAAEQRLAVMRVSNTALAVARDAAEALLAAGNLPVVAVANHRVAFERGGAEIVRQELAVATARERLARAIGGSMPRASWSVVPLAPVGELGDGHREAARRAVAASLDLAALDRRLVAARRGKALTELSGWLPRTSVDLHALDTRPEPAGGEPGGWRFGGGVSVEVPIFDRGQGRVRSQAARRDGLSERRAALAIELGSLGRELGRRVRDTHEVAQRYERHIVPAQRGLADEILRQYNAMQVGVFDLLQARRSQLDVELAEIDARRAYWDAVAALEVLLQGARLSLDDASPLAIADDDVDDDEGEH